MIYLIIIAIVLVLSLDMGWNNVLSADRNNLVFEKRNKAYGAFLIRNDYLRALFIALAVAVGILITALAIPYINRWMNQAEETAMDMTKEVVIDLKEPPPVDETEPPPPPPPPPPPVMETIKFTPPEVTEEELPEDEIPPPQEQLSETNVGEKTQEGEKGLDLAPIDDNSAIGNGPEEIFTIVEEMPQFPGGEQAMIKYIYDNIKYPPLAREAGITGTVYISWVVNREGKVTNVEILRGVKGGKDLDKEAERVIGSMPGWKPGKQNGRPASVKYNMPIKFSLK